MKRNLTRRTFIAHSFAFACTPLLFPQPVNAASSVNTNDELFVSKDLTPPGTFTSGAEGPACDIDGNLYAVSYDHEGTIGRVFPDGTSELFVELPDGSTGNGIRFDSKDTMYVADYTGHNILAIDMKTRAVEVFAHQETMNQPNDIAIDRNDRIYASDPNWRGRTGNIWRIDPDGSVTLLETIDGTTNGVEVSSDDTKLYVNTSNNAKVWVYDLSVDGTISNRRLLTEFPDIGSDGMRCDIDGNIYVTRNGRGYVVKVAPDGTILEEIRTTGQRPSNIAFGGPDGRTCYVTMADRGNIETFRVDRPGRSWQMYQDRITYVAENKQEIPSKFRITSVYPNPFNAVATVEFHLETDSRLELSVFNTLGQKVVVLFEGHIHAGSHSVPFNAQSLPSGMYFARLSCQGGSTAYKTTLLR